MRALCLPAEDSIRKWLKDMSSEGEEEIAPLLADHGVTTADLDELRGFCGRRMKRLSRCSFSHVSCALSRAADALVNSTDRIFDLIEAVKSYSNMDRAPIIDVDVPEGLDATLQMFGSRMNNVEVERDYEPGLPRISAYGGELNQVWTALIENALDAMGNKGCMRLACRREAEMLLVEIWDCGPGIPPEIQERIFEPFFSTKPPGRGPGLGP